ncbi:hypothetical protein BH09MYX1_BH09MYX1_55130 [soil metagenome]
MKPRALLTSAALAFVAATAHADPTNVAIDDAVESARTRGFDRLLADAAQARAEGEGRADAQLPNPALVLQGGPMFNYKPCADCWRFQLGAALYDSGLIMELLSGRHGAKSDAALYAVDAAAADRATTRRALEALVREAAVRLGVAEALLRAATDQAGALAKSLDAQRLRAPQVIDEGALARFELQKAASDRAVIDGVARIRSAQAALAFLVGDRGIAPEYRVDEAILDLPVPNALANLDEHGAAARASTNRSEITSVDALTRSADASADAARAARVPTVVFGLWVQGQGIGYPANTPLSVGGSVELELPLFDQKQGLVRTADAELLAQRLAATRTRATVTWDAASSVVALSAARAIEASARAAEASAKTALAVVTLQFDAGAVPIVDRLDAERAYAAARGARALASGDVQIAVIELGRALGTEAR